MTIKQELNRLYHRVCCLAQSAGITLVQGTNITIDNTDPKNPIISATGEVAGSVAFVDITGSATDNTSLSNELDGKVDTVAGKSLIDDDEITRLADVENVNITDSATVTVTGTYPNISLEAVGGGSVDSVNTQTGVVVLDTDDISEGTNKYVTAAEKTKLSNLSGTNSGDNATNTTSNTYADAKVADAIADGVTTIAPSQNAVFDALALKQPNITLTTTGSSGAATLISNTLNIPQYSGGGGGTIDTVPTNGSTNAVSSNGTFDSLATKFTNLEYLGVVFNKTTFPNLTGFVNNGSTQSIVSNQIQFTGGTNVFTKSLDVDFTTSLEKWTITGKILVGTRSTTSYGLPFGIRSGGSFNAAGGVDLTTNAASGSVYVYDLDATILATSTAKLTIANGDEVMLMVERNEGTITTTAWNVTTKSAPVSVSYVYTFTSSSVPVLPNAGKFAIFNLGGTHTLETFNIYSSEKKHLPILAVGDSKTVGYYATYQYQRWASLLRQKFDVGVWAGASIGTASVLAGMPEILSLAPQRVILNIGRNDLGGMSDATIFANYDSIVSQMVAAGIEVFHLLPLWESTLNQTTLSAHVTSTYVADHIIDGKLEDYNGTSTNVLHTDGIHPNSAGNQKIYESIIASDYFKVASDNREVGLSELTTKPGTNSTVNILSITGGGNIPVLAGLNFKYTSSVGYIFAGTNAAATGSIILGQGGGKTGFGDTTTPAAWVHVTKANSTTVPALRLTPGTITTTPQIGAFDINANAELMYSTSAVSTSRGFVQGTNYIGKSATYTATSNDWTIDCTANTFTVTLPTAVGISGRTYNIKNSGAGVITVATTSSQTIDGSTTYSLATQYKYIRVQSNGANWIVIGNN